MANGNRFGIKNPDDVNNLPLDEATKQQLRAQAFPAVPTVSPDFGQPAPGMPIDMAPLTPAPMPAVPMPAMAPAEPLVPATTGRLPMPAMAPDPIELTQTQMQRQSTQLPAATRKAIDESFKSQAEAQKAMSDAATSEALVRANTQELLAAQMQENIAKLQASDAQRAAAVDAARRDYQQAVTNFENQPLDSGRLWNNASTGDKIFMGVAMALGALGAGFRSDGSNPVLGVIENAIKSDIEAQKLEMARRKDVASTKRTVYTDILAQTGNERLAELGALDMGLKTAQQRLEAAVTSSKIPQLQAQGQAQLAEIQARRAQLAADLDKQIVSTVSRTEQVLPKAAAGAEVGTIKDVPSTFVEQHMAARKTMNTIDRVERLGTKDRAGRVSYAYDAVKRSLGLEDADFARDTTELTNILLTKAKALGPNPSNRDAEIIAQALPDLKSNPAAFAAKMEAIKAGTIDDVEELERTYPVLSQYRKPAVPEQKLK